MGECRLHDDVSDSKLKTLWLNYLANIKNPKLKGFKLCGSRLIKAPLWNEEVYVASNGDTSTIFGTASCHSAWACPVCTAKVMARKGAEIACLIDALAKWKSQKAFMLTFTLPHTRWLSCERIFGLLRETWRMFMRAGKRGRNSEGKSLGVLGEFRSKFQIEHIVRVYEVNYGENGWHPHIHALFFTKNLDEVGLWEDKLSAFWLRCAKHCAYKLFVDPCDTDLKQKDLLTEGQYRGYRDTYGRDTFKVGMDAEANQKLLRHIDPKALREELREELNSSNEQKRIRACRRLEVELLFAEYKHKPVTGHRAVYFSRDSAGNVRQIKSSHYISGWSGDSELTAQVKTASSKHYSPYELLLEAQKATDINVRNKWLALYTEYALATRGRKRTAWTPAESKIIAKYKLTNEYITTVKKTLSDKAKGRVLVCWFDKRQWQKIWRINKTTDLIANILLVAKQMDWELMRDFLLEYDIRLRPNEDNCQLAVARQILNCVA